MGTCCSTIHKKKKRGRRDDVYDPEDVNQKMIYENNMSTANNNKKKEMAMAAFNTDTVKAALEHVQDEVEEEVEVESPDSSDEETSTQLNHSPKTKGNQIKPTAKTAPLPKTVGMHCILKHTSMTLLAPIKNYHVAFFIA